MGRFSLQILSLFISLLLWFYVNFAINPTVVRRYNINIGIRGGSSLKEVLIEPAMVTIQLQGQRMELVGMNPEQELQAYVDVANLDDKTQSTFLKLELIFPPRFTLLYQSETGVKATLKKLFRRDFFLETKILGEPRDGTLIDKIYSKQADYISVLGEKSILDRIEKVISEVKVNDITADFTASYPLILLDKQENRLDPKELGLKLTPEMVVIAATVKKGYPSRSLPLELELLGQLPEGYKLVQNIQIKGAGGENLTKIDIEGPRKLMEEVKVVKLGPLDLSTINKNQLVRLHPILPDGLKGVDATIEYYGQIVLEEEIVEKWIHNVNIVCMGRNEEEYSYAVTPNFCDILVRGRINEIEALIAAREPVWLPVDNLPSRDKSYVFRLWYPTSSVRIKKIVPPRAEVLISPLVKGAVTPAIASSGPILGVEKPPPGVRLASPSTVVATPTPKLKAGGETGK